MRRRVERALLLALLVLAGGFVLRKPLRIIGWSAVGALELIRVRPGRATSPPGTPPVHIAHAGGAFRGLRYTNAEEALEHNYAGGTRWF
jgi:hypothetical protein